MASKDVNCAIIEDLGISNEPASWVCVEVGAPVTKEKVREEVVNGLDISSYATLLVRVQANPPSYKRLDLPSVNLDDLSALFVKAVPPKGASHFFALGIQEACHVIVGCHRFFRVT